MKQTPAWLPGLLLSFAFEPWYNYLILSLLPFLPVYHQSKSSSFSSRANVFRLAVIRTVKCGEQIPFPFPVLKKLKTCLPVMIPQIICKYYHHMTCDVFGFSMCWVEARKRGSSTSSCCSKNDYRCLQQNKVLLHPREPWIWKRFLLAKKYESIHLTKHSSSSTNLTNLIQQIYAWSPSSNHQPSLNSLLISQVLLSSWRS